MKQLLDEVKREVLLALSHQEAEDGLFYSNFRSLHEEDERPTVNSPSNLLNEALTDLVRDGVIELGEVSDKVVFRLVGLSEALYLRAS